MCEQHLSKAVEGKREAEIEIEIEIEIFLQSKETVINDGIIRGKMGGGERGKRKEGVQRSFALDKV